MLPIAVRLVSSSGAEHGDGLRLSLEWERDAEIPTPARRSRQPTELPRTTNEPVPSILRGVPSPLMPSPQWRRCGRVKAEAGGQAALSAARKVNSQLPTKSSSMTTTS